MLSPAKINWYLRVAGKRPDDFHEIASIVSLLNFGDELLVEPSDEDSFFSNHPDIKDDKYNLVIQARDLYREVTGFTQPVTINLQKHIPLGSGFGGGSSNASTALSALNQLNPNPITRESMIALSAKIGSDCPLFFGERFSLIRGRGEIVEPIEIGGYESLLDKVICIFHPGFQISAGWAYQTLALNTDNYTSTSVITEEIDAWTDQTINPIDHIQNDLTKSVYQKYMSIPAIVNHVYDHLGIRIYMSGSGSGCYAILNNRDAAKSLKECVGQCWGDAFFEICNILEANSI